MILHIMIYSMFHSRPVYIYIMWRTWRNVNMLERNDTPYYDVPLNTTKSWQVCLTTNKRRSKYHSTPFPPSFSVLQSRLPDYYAYLELLLYLRQFLHLLTQLERVQYGIFRRKSHVGGASKCPIGVQPRTGPFQGVVILFNNAVGTLARNWMRFFDDLLPVQEHLWT